MIRYLQSDPPRCQSLNVVLLGPDVVFSEVRDTIQLHRAFIYACPDNARNFWLEIWEIALENELSLYSRPSSAPGTALYFSSSPLPIFI